MTMARQRDFTKHLAPRDWVFSWRVRKAPFFPKLVALGLAGAAFFFLITAVRIRVIMPERISQKKASVILLTDDAVGRALTLRAQEGGPFPSRFEPSEWAGLRETEERALAAARFTAPVYQPVLGDLAFESEVPPLRLAAPGVAVFPKRDGVNLQLPEDEGWVARPQLFPLAGISLDELPVELPDFEMPVDAAMSAAAWRFLVRLDREGGVTECVSLENAGGAGAGALETWLKRVRFKPDRAGPAARWISLGIQWINQKADGSDAD